MDGTRGQGWLVFCEGVYAATRDSISAKCFFIVNGFRGFAKESALTVTHIQRKHYFLIFPALSFTTLMSRGVNPAEANNEPESAYNGGT